MTNTHNKEFWELNLSLTQKLKFFTIGYNFKHFLELIELSNKIAAYDTNGTNTKDSICFGIQ